MGLQVKDGSTGDYDHELVPVLLRERSRLETERRQLKEQVTGLMELVKEDDNAISAIDVLLARYGRSNEANSGEPKRQTAESDTCKNSAAPATDDERYDVRCGEATVSDIIGCQTQREALYVIARKNCNILELNPASDLILAAELSRGQRTTVIGTLHNFMTQSPDWEWTAPSVFQLVADTVSDDFSPEQE